MLECWAEVRQTWAESVFAKVSALENEKNETVQAQVPDKGTLRSNGRIGQNRRIGIRSSRAEEGIVKGLTMESTNDGDLGQDDENDVVNNDEF